MPESCLLERLSSSRSLKFSEVHQFGVAELWEGLEGDWIRYAGDQFFTTTRKSFT